MKGNKMTIFVLCFFASVMFFSAGLYFYENQGNTAFHKTLVLITSTNVEVKSLNELVTSNIGTVGTANLKVKALEEDLKKMREELDVFRDQVAETREKQMKLREDLSKKRTQIVLPKGLIPLEVYSNQSTVTGTPPKEIKKIQKQMKELSR